MALVLRKAVLPKNVSLLKCIKGRSLANAANKKNPAPLSSAVACRSMKDEAKIRPVRFARIGSMHQLPCVGRHREFYRSVALRYCMSCPDLVPTTRTQCRPLPRHHSPPPRASHNSIFSRPNIPFCSLSTQYSFLHPNTSQTNITRSYAKPACPCPCPFPCGPCGCPCGCGCLPPPCNQPPKCIQYMTGYYYYPYGFWFCGPYHVQGQCSPCGPCGPCPCPCPSCPPKCPCPACICPAAASFVSDGPSGMPKAEPPRPQSPQAPRGPPPLSNQIKCPLPQDSPQARTGLSKFFPFNSSIAPGGLNGPKDSKKQMPSTFSALMCPYSTNVHSIPRSRSIPSERQYDQSCFSAYSQTNFNLNKKSPPTLPFPSSDSNCFGNPRSKVPAHAFNKSASDSSPSYVVSKRSQSQMANSCPQLEKPRALLSPVQRDRPRVKPGVFDYTSIPNYKSPYPLPNNEPKFKPYEFSPF